MKKKKKDIGLKIGLGAVLFLLALVAVVMILLGHTPEDYLPMAIPQTRQVSPYLTHQLGPEFFNAMQLGKPFTLTLEQRYVNEIFIFAAGTLELEEVTLSSPMVVFGSGAFVFMVTAQIKGVSSVLSVTAAPVVDENGLLHPNIHSVNLGAVPVTEAARRIAKRYADDYFSSEIDDQTEAIVRGILNNQPIEPVITIANQYKVRLLDIKIEEGKLILRIEPLEN